MKNRTFVSFGLLACVAASADAALIPMPDGLTVYDTHLHARWLANANLAGTPEGRAIAFAARIATITPGGAMDYATALQWLATLNGMNGGWGYLGHNTWTLPTSPVNDGVQPLDPGCTSTAPSGDKFGFNCTYADLAGLFDLKGSLGLQWPNTPVPIPDLPLGPFHHFQPYLYWTGTKDLVTGHGFQTFSFNTGFAGSNSTTHYMYALPMITGRVRTRYDSSLQRYVPVHYVPAGVGTLEVSTDGQLVYDPSPVDATFLADANLAQSQTFGAQCASYEDASDKKTVFPPGIPCIAPDGSMAADTANVAWLSGMNSYDGVGWLGRTDWQLPPDPGGCGNIGCADSPMGDLYYNQLRLTFGTPVVAAPGVNVGPFSHVQPYLYWSCGAPVTNPPCQTATPPVSTQEWSFSFGNGFQGTDLQANSLYVWPYFLQAPAQALADAIGQALGNGPEVGAFLRQATHIASAPDERAKAGALRAFVNHVNAQRDNALSSIEADELIALARAI